MLNVSALPVLLVTMMLLAGCGARPNQAPPPITTASALATATEGPATPAVLPTPIAATPISDPAAICPDETDGTTLVVSRENGFCFLYPATLNLGQDNARPEEVLTLSGKPLPLGGMHQVALHLSVAYNGPADGLDSAQYAARWLELNLPGMELPVEPVTIGGQAALVIDDLSGYMMPARRAFVVANGVKIQLFMTPPPHAVPELADEPTLAWETVTGSIVFFPPQNSRPVVRPADVCPVETADSKVVVDLVGGYCLRYPGDFGPNPEFVGSIIGGPELGPFDGFDSVRTSLTVGTYEEYSQEADAQALRPSSEQIDSDSVLDTTIGGYPAVVYDFTGGPWRQRNAKILVGRNVYTFVAQPWDAEKFPQALPDVERLWAMAVESIAFFDKWR